MKIAGSLLLFMFLVTTSVVAWGQQKADQSPNLNTEAKYPNFVKHWFVGLGPVVSNNLPGTNGTKFAVTLGYEQGLSEHWSLLYFSDNNFDSATLGSTLIQSINCGAQYFFRDRGADNSLFLQADVGYGGSDKNFDASAIGGLALGFQFYRTGDFTFEGKVRYAALNNTGGGAAANWTQVMLGIYF